MHAARGRTDTFGSLTALRGIAALAVVLYHSHYLRDLSAPYTLILVKGYCAVDLFFVLSGFVLTHAYGHVFVRLKPRDLARFALLRLARIYPLHLATLLVVLIIRLALLASGGCADGPCLDGQFSGQAFLAHALLVQSWGLDFDFSWNYPSWSVSCEWAAYLLAPLFMRACASQRLGLAARIAAAAGAAAAIVMIGLKTGSLDQTGSLGVLRCVAEFAIGVVSYGVYARLEDDARSRHVATRVAVAGAALLAAMHFGAPDPAIIACVVAVVLMAALADRRLRVPRPLLMLGERSYAIYMVQVACAKWFASTVIRLAAFGPEEAGARKIEALVYVAATIAFAELAHRFIEIPARAALRLRIERRWGASALDLKATETVIAAGRSRRSAGR